MKARSAKNGQQPANELFLDFTASVGFDKRLWKYDIAGSIAHAHALQKARLISKDECGLMIEGLRRIAKDFDEGRIELSLGYEDIHMNIEQMLTSAIGNVGSKLHTGRSRNDQVALDMRMLVRERLVVVAEEVAQLQGAILEKARAAKDVIIPGYTHLQHAQPILLSHHLLAHFWRLERDIDRLFDCYRRTNISPLGAGALAGSGFRLDRALVARLLRFKDVTENSLDAVSDRDFVAESAFALSLMMMHLSSLSEELVLWSSQEFGFVKIPERLSSGSSMMPQKRNPDIPELVRGKSGRAVGDLVAILTLLKSLPLAYNRDLQEDKENLFDVFDTVEASLRALTSFLAEAEFDEVRMGKAAEVGLMTATDLADFLASKGMPFREAHQLVKKIVDVSEGDATSFSVAAASMLKEHVSDWDLRELGEISLRSSVERRSIPGGTAPSAVEDQVRKAVGALEKNEERISELRDEVSAVDKLLE